mmetsp:Transcript_60382/g.72581  ORF Transcript_60382/g.72581 Transcript_60382/m.72581 type:complete len:290 (+) Transcript_60382:418-1287(+)
MIHKIQHHIQRVHNSLIPSLGTLFSTLLDFCFLRQLQRTARQIHDINNHAVHHIRERFGGILVTHFQRRFGLHQASLGVFQYELGGSLEGFEIGEASGSSKGEELGEGGAEGCLWVSVTQEFIEVGFALADILLEERFDHSGALLLLLLLWGSRRCGIRRGWWCVIVQLQSGYAKVGGGIDDGIIFFQTGGGWYHGTPHLFCFGRSHVILIIIILILIIIILIIIVILVPLVIFFRSITVESHDEIELTLAFLLVGVFFYFVNLDAVPGSQGGRGEDGDLLRPGDLRKW